MTGSNNINQSSNLTNLCNKYNDAIHKKKSVKIISNLEQQMLIEYIKHKK